MRLRTWIIAGALLLGAGAAAHADPPLRAGRIAAIEGAVSFHAADQDQWVPATLNYPLTTGDALWTEPGARAEIEVGPVELWLDHATELDIDRLDDSATEIDVPQGAVNVHVHALPPGGIRLETELGEITLLEPGTYHVEGPRPAANAPPDRLQVAVLEGSARVAAAHGTFELRAGESALVGGQPTNVTLAEAAATPFDDWVLAHEQREQERAAARYVSPDVTGYQDLDAYGSWQTVPQYGAVWVPASVPQGWAPYRYGHWAYVAPWGWSWVDDAPWGFAPFHYGRWIDIHGRWGWWPGDARERPAYAPALVAFIGGSGWSVRLNSGPARPAIGWVPLAPHEVFHPYYTASESYARRVNVNVVNRTTINNITVNRPRDEDAARFANRGAATVVTRTAFTDAAPVHRNRLAVPETEIGRTKADQNVAHLTPSRAARDGVATERNVPPAAAPHAAAPQHAERTPATAAPQALPRAPGPAIVPHNQRRPAAPNAAREAAPARAPSAAREPASPAAPRAVPTRPAPPPAAAERREPARNAERRPETRAPERQAAQPRTERPAQAAAPRPEPRRPTQHGQLQATEHGWKRGAEPAHAAPAAPQKAAPQKAAPPRAAPANKPAAAAPAQRDNKDNRDRKGREQDDRNRGG